MIAENNNRFYRACRMKETLRLLLKIKDVDGAATELKRWLWWAGHSRIKAFKELYQKIKRHWEHILNMIRLGMSNARIEATNNKIKLNKFYVNWSVIYYSKYNRIDQSAIWTFWSG